MRDGSQLHDIFLKGSNIKASSWNSLACTRHLSMCTSGGRPTIPASLGSGKPLVSSTLTAFENCCSLLRCDRQWSGMVFLEKLCCDSIWMTFGVGLHVPSTLVVILFHLLGTMVLVPFCLGFGRPPLPTLPHEDLSCEQRLRLRPKAVLLFYSLRQFLLLAWWWPSGQLQSPLALGFSNGWPASEDTSAFLCKVCNMWVLIIGVYNISVLWLQGWVIFNYISCHCDKITPSCQGQHVGRSSLLLWWQGCVAADCSMTPTRNQKGQVQSRQKHSSS